MKTFFTPQPMGVYLLILGYVLSILFANLTLDDFIPLPFYGQLSIGTVFFAVIFTLRDRIHDAAGLSSVYLAISIALVVNVITAYIIDTPPRFIFASFVAILVSELTDTAVFQKLRNKRWATRVLTSNAISVPLDSVLFSLLAFYGIMSNSEILQIIYADIIVKYSISALLIIRFKLIGKERA